MASSGFIDITMPFGHPAGTWPGDAPFTIEWTARLGDEGPLGVNLSRVCSSPHNGTHSDAPYHVLADGVKSESLDLALFLGPCLVIDSTAERGPLVTGAPSMELKRVLFKTRTGTFGRSFPKDFRGLDPAMVKRLVANGVRLVGTDAPSVDRGTLDSHRLVFEAGGALLENLDLSKADPGAYELIALPLKVEGLCAAPVRAILRPLR